MGIPKITMIIYVIKKNRLNTWKPYKRLSRLG